MIKIIKAGTRKKIECADCGALLSYEEGDIKVVNNPENGLVHYNTFIECPQCKNKIHITNMRN